MGFPSIETTRETCAGYKSLSGLFSCCFQGMNCLVKGSSRHLQELKESIVAGFSDGIMKLSFPEL